MLVAFYFSLKVFSFFTSWLWQSTSDKCSSFLKRLNNVKFQFKFYFCFFFIMILRIYLLHFKLPFLFCFAYTRIDKAIHDNKIVVPVQYSIAQFFFYSFSQP